VIFILDKIKSFIANNKLGLAVALLMLFIGGLTIFLFHTMLGKI